MKDRTSVIFNNPMDKKTIKGAEKSKANYIKKFGDDSNKDYKANFADIKTLDFIGAKNIIFSENTGDFKGKPLIWQTGRYIRTSSSC